MLSSARPPRGYPRFCSPSTLGTSRRSRAWISGAIHSTSQRTRGPLLTRARRIWSGYELGIAALAVDGKRQIEAFRPRRRAQAEAVETDKAAFGPRQRAGPTPLIRGARQPQPHPV